MILLESIDGFCSPGEYARFLGWVDRQELLGELAEVPVDSRYMGNTVLHERWLLEVETGVTWRLVGPDFPFRGIFEPVQTATR